MTEPPAGLGPTPRWASRPPVAPHDHEPPGTWAADLSPFPERRWWIVVLVALVLLGVLGAGGAVLIAYARGADQEVRAAGLSYRVPANWTLGARGPATTTHGITLDGVATGPRYTCGGDRFRATVGSTFLVRRDGVDARAEDAVRDFGPRFATSFYGPGSAVTTSPPTPVTVGTLTGVASLISVQPPAAEDCAGLRGQVRVLALSSPRVGAAGGRAVLLLVLQRDTAGGPATPAPVDEHTVAEILRSVQVTQG